MSNICNDYARYSAKFSVDPVPTSVWPKWAGALATKYYSRDLSDLNERIGKFNSNPTSYV